MLAKMRTLESEGVKFCARTLHDLFDGLGNDGGFLFEARSAKMSLLELVYAYLNPQSSKYGAFRQYWLSIPGTHVKGIRVSKRDNDNFVCQSITLLATDQLLLRHNDQNQIISCVLPKHVHCAP